MSDRKVVDIGPERMRRKAKDLYVECARCGQKTFMHHGRCQRCGLWFDGEAFQFAPSDLEDRPRHKPWLRQAARWSVFGLGAMLVYAAVHAVIGAL